MGEFHHVGVAVRSIERAVELYVASFGAIVESGLFHDLEQGVRIQFVRIGTLRIELLEPAATPSPLDGILRKGLSLYHTAFETREFDALVGQAATRGMTVVSPPKPAIAFEKRRVAFLSSGGLLVELIEAASP